MDPYIEHYYTFLKERQKYSNEHTYFSILSTLWTCYTIGHTIDSQAIRTHYEEVESPLASLSQKKKRACLRSIVELCLEHERIAFQEGIQVGIQLFSELTDTKPPPKDS